MDDIDERHFIDVADSVAEGYVVPFLGAGANLCDRPDEVAWEPGRFLPNGSELAHALAEKGRYPNADDNDLLRVSQYIGAVRGEKDLYRYLRTIFDVDYPPNSLHRFLARIPAYLRERGAPSCSRSRRTTTTCSSAPSTSRARSTTSSGTRPSMDVWRGSSSIALRAPSRSGSVSRTSTTPSRLTSGRSSS